MKQALDHFSTKLREFAPHVERITYRFPQRTSSEHSLVITFSEAVAAKRFADNFAQYALLRPHLKVEFNPEASLELAFRPRSEDGDFLLRLIKKRVENHPKFRA